MGHVPLSSALAARIISLVPAHTTGNNRGSAVGTLNSDLAAILGNGAQDTGICLTMDNAPM